MKLSEQTKEKLNKTKEVIKKYEPAILAGGVILMLGGGYLYFKHLDKNALDEIGKLTNRYKTIEGSGPVWEKIRALFTEINMEPGECWMIEAGTGEDIGKKIIERIPGIELNAPCEAMIF